MMFACLLASPVNMCLCLHAEENALLEAGRERIGVDSILYCNTSVPSSQLSSLSAAF